MRENNFTSFPLAMLRRRRRRHCNNNYYCYFSRKKPPKAKQHVHNFSASPVFRLIFEKNKLLIAPDKYLFNVSHYSFNTYNNNNNRDR